MNNNTYDNRNTRYIGKTYTQNTKLNREYNAQRKSNYNKPEIISPERAKLIEEQKQFAETQKILSNKIENIKISNTESTKENNHVNAVEFPSHGVRYKKDGSIDKRYLKKDGTLSTERARYTKATKKAERLKKLEEKFDTELKNKFIQIIPIDEPLELKDITISEDKKESGININKIEEYAEDIVLFKRIKNIIRNGITLSSSEANKLSDQMTSFMEKYLGMIDEYDKFLNEYSHTLDEYEKCKKELQVVKDEDTTEKK